MARRRLALPKINPAYFPDEPETRRMSCALVSALVNVTERRGQASVSKQPPIRPSGLRQKVTARSGGPSSTAPSAAPSSGTSYLVVAARDETRALTQPISIAPESLMPRSEVPSRSLPSLAEIPTIPYGLQIASPAGTSPQPVEGD